ncbi:MAG: DUF4270 domain-containing protein [Paludibacteraceae bacterium]|nr:DUF4270 domain-containing protein [Paludibacteraceae bacterium]
MGNKNIWIITTVCLAILLFSSCNDDVVSAGSSALQGDDADGVVVRVDTLSSILSSIQAALPVYSSSDSCLLGECCSQDYGILKADLLTQFACPEGWVYPDSSELDSVCLYVYYRSFYGDGNAPLGINAYDLDGTEQLCYDSAYRSDIDVKRFTTMTHSVLERTEVVSMAHPADSIYSSTLDRYMPFVRMKLNKDYATKIFNIRDFSSQDAFNRSFPGLYITSVYGSSAALYISSLCLTVHYHFTYQEGNTVKRMDDNKVFYANSEVKQLSHYTYTNRDDIIQSLNQDTACDYVLSPANIYTHLTIPTSELMDRIDAGVQNRTPYINMARLRIDVLNGSSKSKRTDNWARPADNMLLLKESAYDLIFKENKLPNDTNALLGTLTSAYNSETTSYDYYYTFNLSSMFTDMLRHSKTDTLQMILVPVETEYSTTSSASYLSSVRLKQSVSATKISSSRNTQTPMRVEVVYSGFNTKKVK